MSKMKIRMTSKQQQQISLFLQNQTIPQQDIDEIVSGEFEIYNNANDLENSFGGLRKHHSVLEKLSDGYTMDELSEQGISKLKIQDFERMLKEKNLTAEQAKAIYQYSVGSNMILGIKRGTTTINAVRENIIKELEQNLRKRGITSKDIEQIKQYVISIDYQNTALHDNYDKMNQYMQHLGLPQKSYVTARSAIQDMNRREHINETIIQLEEGIGNTRLPKSMKLYRAVSRDYLEQNLLNNDEKIENLVGRTIHNSGQTSTSPLYDSSFASLDNCDIVFEIYAPKGTRGSYVAELSAYDSTEQEVLLNPNILYITGVQSGVIDKNGRTKDIIQALCLSKDLECYRGVAQTKVNNNVINLAHNSTTKSNNLTDVIENLPTIQNKFSKFFSKLRARFLKKKPEKNSTSITNINVIETKKKSWDLDLAKKQEIQHEQAEIGEKHRNKQDYSKETLVQTIQHDIEDEEIQT